ncbi:MAG: hypothetical protein WDO18_01705 [Acidobacteriota bacterium]
MTAPLASPATHRALRVNQRRRSISASTPSENKQANTEARENDSSMAALKITAAVHRIAVGTIRRRERSAKQTAVKTRKNEQKLPSVDDS